MKDKYDVSLSGYDKTMKFYAEHGYTLYNMDGTKYGVLSESAKELMEMYGFSTEDRDNYHAMLGVDETSDGRIIVSSWGRKYILELSTNPEDIEYHKERYREYK